MRNLYGSIEIKGVFTVLFKAQIVLSQAVVQSRGCRSRGP